MIRHHPDANVLKNFAEGTLSPSLSVVVSAHCELCSSCDMFVERLIELEAEKIEHQLISNPLDDALTKVMHSIINSNNCGQNGQYDDCFDAAKSRSHATERQISIDGKTFSLPHVLERLIDDKLTWSSYLGKLSHAPVQIGGHNVAQFIYMESGGSIPEHTHKGNEYTLVIDGEYSDGMSHYTNGDISILNGVHKHAPQVRSDKGCLVFTIIDQPLQFTSGWARIINPLSSIFFNSSLK